VNTLKRHLSVANVLSCIALFVALSATAVAATKLSAGQVKAVNIATGAVTNPKLKNLGVTSSKIANGTIVAGKLKNGAVTNPKIFKEAVTATKIKKKAVGTAALAQESVTGGKLGPESVSAAKLSAALYAQLVRNVAYTSATTIEDSEESKTVTANCPAGKQAIGGGARLSGELKAVAITGTNPFSAANGQRTGWSAFAHETGTGQTENWSLEAFAICAEL
jgi:trimeric autotransporter adhesin